MTDMPPESNMGNPIVGSFAIAGDFIQMTPNEDIVFASYNKHYLEVIDKTLSALSVITLNTGPGGTGTAVTLTEGTDFVGFGAATNTIMAHNIATVIDALPGYEATHDGALVKIRGNKLYSITCVSAGDAVHGWDVYNPSMGRVSFGSGYLVVDDLEVTHELICSATGFVVADIRGDMTINGYLSVTADANVDLLNLTGTGMTSASGIDMNFVARTGSATTALIDILTSTSSIVTNESLVTIIDSRNHDDGGADTYNGFYITNSGNWPGTNASTTMLFDGIYSGILGASGANGILYGYKFEHSGTMTNGTMDGFRADLTSTISAGTATGVNVIATTAQAAGSLYGTKIAMPATYTGAVTTTALAMTGNSNTADILSLGYGESITVNRTNAANAQYGVSVVKNLASATGATAQTNNGLLVSSTNASTAIAGTMTVSNILASITETNSAAAASTDVYAGTLFGLSYTATTTATGTATNSTTGFLMDYNVNETAGTNTQNSWNVAYVDYDSTGTPVYAVGTYQLLAVNGADAGTPTFGGATIMNGVGLDLTGIKITDANLTLAGIAIAMPTGAATSTVAGIMETLGNGGMGISINNATTPAIGAKNVIYETLNVGDVGAGATRGEYLDINETVVGTNGTAIVGYGGLLTGFSTGLADLYGMHLTFDGTKDGGDTTTGVLVDANLTINNAGEYLRGFYFDGDGITHTNGIIYGADIDLSGAHAAGTAIGVNIVMPTAYGAGAEAALYATGDGNVVGLLSDGFVGVLTADRINAANAEYTLDISKDLTLTATAAVGRAITNNALRVTEALSNVDDDAGAYAIVANNDMATYQLSHTMATAGGAHTDTLGATAMDISVAATTTGANDVLNMTARALDIAYSTIFGAGSTFNLNATDIIRLNFDVGAGTAISTAGGGNLNMMYLDGNGFVPGATVANNTLISGVKVDWSSASANDASASIYGSYMSMPIATHIAANEVVAYKAMLGATGGGLFIENTTTALTEVKNLVYLNGNVSTLAVPGDVRGIYTILNETVATSDTSTIYGQDIHMTALTAGRADFYGSRIYMDGTKDTGAEVVYGQLIDMNQTINQAGITAFGQEINLDGITVTDASSIIGLSIDAGGITTPDNADYFSALTIYVPNGRGTAVDANVRGIVSGRIEQGAPYFEDEFWGRQFKQQWAVRTNTGARGDITSAPTTDLNGWVRFKAGATAGDEMSYDWKDIYGFDSSLRPTFECRVRLTQAADDFTNVYIGLMGAGAAYDGGAGDMIMFSYNRGVLGGDLWYLRTSRAGAAGADIASGIAASQAPVVLRFEYIADDTVEFFINGASIGVKTGATVPNANMQPVIAIIEDSGAEKSVEVDYIKIWQDRS
jgi:hypothetical protein